MERPETIKRKEKKKKLKKEVEKLKKDNKIKNKKLTKHEENQAVLTVIKEKRDEKKEILEQEKVLSRSFLCNCGCKVTLFGNIDLNVINCNTCS